MSHTLLLAEDSVTIQRVIELTFADEDIRVIAVGDGQQAIDRLAADPPDIVLADISMPERDGYEVATFIKEDPALAHIPVVLLTGAFESVDEDRARQVGCDAVLVKPFEPQVVIDRVHELLGVRTAAAVPVIAGPVGVVPPEDAAADALTLPLETAGRPTHDPDKTLEPSSRVRSGGPELTSPSDGPLVDDLDQMDAAFDRFEAGAAVASGRGRTGSEDLGFTLKDVSASEESFDPLEGALSVLEGAIDQLGLERRDAKASEESFDSLEGALSVLEGAIDQLGLERRDAKADEAPAGPDVPPCTPDAASAPPDRPVEAPVPAAGSGLSDEAPVPTSEVVGELTSLTEAPRPVKAPEPPPAEVAPPPAPVDTPPSLADAFASLLAAEQGDAERAQTLYPWPRPASSPGGHEALIDQVVDRVIARLSDGVTGELVANVVARVAEKLVREALERGKAV